MNQPTEEIWYWAYHWDERRGSFRQTGTRSRDGHGLCYLYDQWYNADLRTLRQVYLTRPELINDVRFYIDQYYQNRYPR